MLPGTPPPGALGPTEEAEVQRRHGRFFSVLGLALICLSLAALLAPFLATRTTIPVLASLVLLGGVLQTALGIFRLRWQGVFLPLLNGNLYAVLGLMVLVDRPLSPVFVGMLVSAFYLINGTFQVSSVVARPPPRWPWVLAGGLLSMVIAILVRQGWPWSVTDSITVFMGLDMLANGLTWSMWAAPESGPTGGPGVAQAVDALLADERPAPPPS